MDLDREQARVMEIVNLVLDDGIGIIEAVRILLPILRAHPEIVLEKDDRNFLTGVESETDDLPVGRLRKEWHPDFLPEKDKQIARCETLWSDQVKIVCGRIAQQLRA